MKTHTVAIIAFVAAALALAAYLTTSRSGPAAPDAVASGPALPTLTAKINDAAEVVVRRSSGSFTFRRAGDGWGLVEKSGYPVNFENVRALIIALADLKLVEAKTTNPALYSRIGVQDVESNPGDADAASAESQHVQIEVRDSAGAVLGSVILGTQKWGPTPEVFIRRAGEAQSWLARGRVDVPSDQMSWVDKAAVNIPRDRVRRATITHPAGESITVSRGSRQMPSLMVQDIPAGRELTTPGAGDQIGNLLSFLSFDDVAPASTVDLAAGEPGSRAVVHLFDGLLVSVSTAKVNDATWARIEAAYEPPPPPQAEPPADVAPDADSAAAEAARLEAESLNKRLAPWVFKLQDHKLRVLQTTWDSLLKPLAPAAETPASDGAPATDEPNSTESDED